MTEEIVKQVEIAKPHKLGDKVNFGETYQVVQADGSLYEYTIGYAKIEAWPEDELDAMKQKHLDMIALIETKKAKVAELKPVAKIEDVKSK